MKTRIYLRAEGDSIALEALNKSLPKEDHVGLFRTKKMVNGKVELDKYYWKSREAGTELLTQNSLELEKQIAGLARKYISKLSGRGENVKMSIVVCIHYDSEDEVGGFYLSNDSIDLLYTLRASLDVDAYL